MPENAIKYITIHNSTKNRVWIQNDPFIKIKIKNQKSTFETFVQNNLLIPQMIRFKKKKINLETTISQFKNDIAV